MPTAERVCYVAFMGTFTFALAYKGPLSFCDRLPLQEAVTLLTVVWDVNSDKVFPPSPH